MRRGSLADMAYDQELADRIRRLIGSDTDLTERKMFGGLAFLIGGNMAIAASSQGGAMVRVDLRQSEVLVATTSATPMDMRGRAMPGWLHVSSADLEATTANRPFLALDDLPPLAGVKLLRPRRCAAAGAPA
jgi:hypothetical protein